MHHNIKAFAKIGAAAVGIVIAAGIGYDFWSVLNKESFSRVSAPKGDPIPLKKLEEVALPQAYAGPPFVPVGVYAEAGYTSEYGPHVQLRFLDLALERCPAYAQADDRFAQAVPPSSDQNIGVKGAWCFEAVPGQNLVPRTLNGELLDFRSDAFLANDSKVEYVDVKLASGEVMSVFAGVVSVCDNDGLCSAAVAVERRFPAQSMAFRLPLIGGSDVVLFGSREASGLSDETSPVAISSFPESVSLIKKGEPAPANQADPEDLKGFQALPEAEPAAGPALHRVFEDDDEEVNTVSESATLGESPNEQSR